VTVDSHGIQNQIDAAWTDAAWTDAAWTDDDEELARLAMAAGPPGVVGPRAVPISAYLSDCLSQLPPLPPWYMAPASARVRGRWRLPVVVVITGAFLVIDAWGLCNTFGQLTLA